MSIYYEADDVARAMQAHCPESPKRRSDAATYHKIAQVWCRDIQRCVWEF